MLSRKLQELWGILKSQNLWKFHWYEAEKSQEKRRHKTLNNNLVLGIVLFGVLDNDAEYIWIELDKMQWNKVILFYTTSGLTFNLHFPIYKCNQVHLALKILLHVKTLFYLRLIFCNNIKAENQTSLQEVFLQQLGYWHRFNLLYLN